MKKYLSLILTIVLALALVPNVAMAARVGDVVGYAQPTDIVATINGYQLESYNVDGYTYICVEDLRYYGFNVNYDNYSRTLSFALNGSSNIDPQNSNPNFWAIGSSNTKKKILYTDITTYANGTYTGSANINGKTIINFNALSQFGTVSYDNNRREISLVVDSMNYNPIATLAYFIDENWNDDYRWNTLVRAKGDMIVVTNKSTNIYSLSTVSNLSEFRNRVQSGDLYQDRKELLYGLRSNGYSISSYYEEYFTQNGEKVTSVQIY